jgi:hypothetical protein
MRRAARFDATSRSAKPTPSDPSTSARLTALWVMTSAATLDGVIIC